MDTVVLHELQKQIDRFQVQIDAILVAAEATRTIVDAMVADDAALADQVDLLVAGVDVIQIDYDKTIADAAALILQQNILRANNITDRNTVDLLTRKALNYHTTEAVPTLTFGSSDAKEIKLTNDVTGIHNAGLRKADVSAAEIAFADTTVLTNGNSARYLVSLTAAGALLITNGTQAGSVGAAVLPAVPADNVPLGELLMTADTGTFTPATDEISNANFTDVFTEFTWPQTGTDAIAAGGAHGLGAVVSATGAAVGDQGVTAVGAIEETALGATGESALGTQNRIHN